MKSSIPALTLNCFWSGMILCVKNMKNVSVNLGMIVVRKIVVRKILVKKV